MSTYNKFAYVYDAVYEHRGAEQFASKMFRYTRRLLTALRYRPRSVLDLACGTGTAAVLWAGQNVETFGIDNSAHMLEQARKKARAHKVDITFDRQPMTSFTLPHPVDLVTCYFDSLNYLLTIAELEATFTSVRRALYPGGYFVFDVNTPEAMKTLWDGQVYADESPDLAWIWKNCYYPKTKQAEVRATFFVRRGQVWERFDEIHAERGYSLSEIKRTLKKAALTPVGIYDCLKITRPNRKSLRLAVVAQKQD